MSPSDTLADRIPDAVTLPAVLEALVHRAAGYARHTTAASTRHAYARDWRRFATWCAEAGLEALPATPQTVGLYLTSLAGRLAPVTLGRRVAAIVTVHRVAGHRLDRRHVAVHDVLRGIRRTHGTAQRRVEPAITSLVQRMATCCGDDLAGARDRALLLLGFAAALRRSELVALRVEDLHPVPEGLRVRVRRSKADQEGAGEAVGVVRTDTRSCPVAAVASWLHVAGISEGRVFRGVTRHRGLGNSLSDQSVALIVKRRAEQAGLDPSQFSGHSLRAGLATAAAMRGVEERVICRTTRHRNLETLRRYIRDGEVFVGNASGRIGL